MLVRLSRMSYRDDVDALRARTEALQHEVTERSRDLATTRGLLDDAERRARLPVLDNIQVASPCSAEWGAMTGDERVRSCGDCRKHVYNLSELTRDEAQALIVEHEGKLCVRYFSRADGTILLKDCSIGVGRRRRRRIIAGAVAVLASTGIAEAFVSHATPAALEPVVTVQLGQMKIATPVVPKPVPDQHLYETKGGAMFPSPAPVPKQKQKPR